MEGLTADNIHHRTSVQIVELFCVRHDEVSRPEPIYLFLGAWDRHHGGWANIVVENAKTCQDLRCSDRYRHDRWLFQPRWRPLRKTEFPREDEMPRSDSLRIYAGHDLVEPTEVGEAGPRLSQGS